MKKLLRIFLNSLVVLTAVTIWAGMIWLLGLCLYSGVIYFIEKDFAESITAILIIVVIFALIIGYTALMSYLPKAWETLKSDIKG